MKKNTIVAILIRLTAFLIAVVLPYLGLLNCPESLNEQLTQKCHYFDVPFIHSYANFYKSLFVASVWILWPGVFYLLLTIFFTELSVFLTSRYLEIKAKKNAVLSLPVRQRNEYNEKLKTFWRMMFIMVATLITLSSLFFWRYSKQEKYYQTIFESNKKIAREADEKNKIFEEETRSKSYKIEPPIISHIIENKFYNDKYNFSFTIPENWMFQKEEMSEAPILLSINFTVPEYKGEIFPQIEYFFTISVWHNRSLQDAYELFRSSKYKVSEEQIIVSGRKAYKLIDQFESNEKTVSVIVENGENVIQFVLHSNVENHISQLNKLIDTFKFTR